MANLTVRRVNALPAVRTPSTLYIVKSTNIALAELYFTSEDGLETRRLIDSADVDAKIATAIAASGGGGGGSSGPVTIANAVSRYEALSSVGNKAHCLSSSTQYGNLSWSRVGTVLTINHAAHGRSVGDRIIAKDFNVLNLNSLIAGVTADSFTLTCADTGPLSGTTGKYTCGFKYAHNSEVAGAMTGGTLIAPSGVHDITLMSLRVHTKANSRTSTTYDVTFPTSVYNPVGANTSNDDIYLPIMNIRGDQDTMPVVGNTIAMNQGGAGYSVIRLGALGASVQGQVMLFSF